MLQYFIALLPVLTLYLRIRDKINSITKYRNVFITPGNVIMKDGNKLDCQDDDYIIELSDRYLIVRSHTGRIGHVNKVYIAGSLSSTTKYGIVSSIIRSSLIRISLWMMLSIPFLLMIRMMR